MSEGKFIAYYRVSTQRQGASGLGLEAQQATVREYLKLGGWDLIEEYVEVESGRKKDRPQLVKALAHAKKEKATLLIAKLDRLARNIHFISGLMESGVNFMAADMPEANKLTVQIMAVMAEHESEMIKRRTKDALKAAKARGTVLGKTGKDRARENKDAADAFAESLRNTIESLQDKGVASVRKIKDALNEREIPTPKGGQWHVTSVQRLLERLAA